MRQLAVHLCYLILQVVNKLQLLGVICMWQRCCYFGMVPCTLLLNPVGGTAEQSSPHCKQPGVYSCLFTCCPPYKGTRETATAAAEVLLC